MNSLGSGSSLGRNSFVPGSEDFGRMGAGGPDEYDFPLPQQPQQFPPLQPAPLVPQQRHRIERHDTADKPLFVEVPDNYGTADEPEDGPNVDRKVPNKVHYGGKHNFRMNPKNFTKAVLCIIGAPFIFIWTVSAMTFYVHFRWPTISVVFTALAWIPAVLVALAARKASSLKLDCRWHTLGFILLCGAAVFGTVIGDGAYWYYMQPFYVLRSMKVYTDINPTETTGDELMDAGQIHFSEDSKLLTDMSMSFTSWDTYCVAPIGKGAETSEDALGAYDFWAVGVNCCRSDSPGSFACGEYKNPKARAGLRQWSEEQRHFFRLAVEQAEAAYSIAAKHPVLVYWVQDPDEEVRVLFTKGYVIWVSSVCMHFFANAFLVVAFVVMFRRDSDPGALISSPIV